MQKLLKYLLLVWAAVLSIAAHAGDGQTCDEAIPVDGQFTMQVAGAESVWFTAWTYDLPLTVVFIPSNPMSTMAPEVELDFGCTPGVYEDSILNSYFSTSNGAYIQMPQRLDMDRVVENGRVKFILSVPKRFRDMLTSVGMDYNIQAFVHVTFNESGGIEMDVDNSYTNCLAGGKYLHLNDSIHIRPSLPDQYAIVHYGTFRKDSIRYEWLGNEPATVYLVKDCTPLSDTTAVVLDTMPLQPGESLKLTMQEVRDKMSLYEARGAGDGIYYLRVQTVGEGWLHLHRVDMAAAENGAILLQMGVPVDADSTKLYYFPKTWNDGIRFDSPTEYITRAYISTTGFFSIPSALTGVIGSYTFNAVEDGHMLGISQREMDALTQQAVDNYLYIRFQTRDHTAITPNWWTENRCASVASEPLLIGTRRYTTTAGTYRVAYSRIARGDLKIATLINSTCAVKVSGGCSFTSSVTPLYNTTIPRRGNVTITAEQIAEWADDVDEDGFLYFNIKPAASGNITISTSAPPEEDPEPGECTGTITVESAGHGSVSIVLNN